MTGKKTATGEKAKDDASASRRRSTLSGEAHAPTAAIDPLEIQSAAGNMAIQRLLRSGAIAAKLNVGDPNSPLEDEADRVADQVARLPARPGSCGDAGLKCPEENEQLVQRKSSAAHGTAHDHPTSAPHNVLSGLGSGRPLDPTTRRFFESSLGHDFSGPRIHTGAQADKAASSISARAFTHANDIVFARGQYAPETGKGRRLLAHELAHVVQARRDPSPVLRRDPPTTSTDDRSSAVPSSLAERYPMLMAALPAEARAQIERAVVARQTRSGVAADPQAEGARDPAVTVEVELEHLLDPSAKYLDQDVWPLVYEQVLSGNGNTAGLIVRNEINRRFFQRRGLDAGNVYEIRVEDPSDGPGGNSRLTFVLGDVQIPASSGLLTISQLDSAYPHAIVENVAAEVSDEARRVGEAAAHVRIAERFGANVESYADRVRRDFAGYSVRSIQLQVADARRLKRAAERLSASSLTRQFTAGLPERFDAPIRSLQRLHAEAQSWHRFHQPEMTSQEAYGWAGTGAVSYAGREWESGGAGYLTGGLAYTGAGVLAIFDGLGNLFSFGYQGTRGEIVSAYRQGLVSYSTMEDLSEDAAIRSLTTGIVTVALTVATMGLGGAVAGGLGLARGTLAYGFVAGGTEAALGNLAMMGTETLLTEVRPEFSDPYAQAVWQQGSHGVGSFAVGTGLGFATGGLFGLRGYPGNVRTPTALALPEETLLSGPSMIGRSQPPVWEITSLGIEQTTGMQRFAGRHISGEVFELVIDRELTGGYLIRQSTGEVIHFGPSGFQRTAGLLPEGVTGPSAAAHGEPAVIVLGQGTPSLGQMPGGARLGLPPAGEAPLALRAGQQPPLPVHGGIGTAVGEVSTLSVTRGRQPIIFGPTGEVVSGRTAGGRVPLVLDAEGRPWGGSGPPGGTDSPIIYGAGGEPISGMVRVNLRRGVYHTPDSPYYNTLTSYVEMPEEWAAGLFRRAWGPRTPITPAVIEGRVAESAGAAPGGPGIITGRAQTPQSVVTAIIADKGEAMAYQAALSRGEYGLQRPLGANVPGSDFITASVERVPTSGGTALQATIYVNDAKISGVPRFPSPAGAAKPSWLDEVRAAVAPNRLSLPDSAVEDAIMRAAAEGRIRIRQVEIDYSPQYSGPPEQRVRFRSSAPATSSSP